MPNVVETARADVTLQTYRRQRVWNSAIQSLENACVSGKFRVVWDDPDVLLVHTITSICGLYSSGKHYIYQKTRFPSRAIQNFYRVDLNVCVHALNHFVGVSMLLKPNAARDVLEYDPTSPDTRMLPTLHLFDDIQDPSPLVEVAANLLQRQIDDPRVAVAVRDEYKDWLIELSDADSAASSTSSSQSKTAPDPTMRLRDILKRVLTVYDLLAIPGGISPLDVTTADKYATEMSSKASGATIPCTKCSDMFKVVTPKLSMVWIFLHVFSCSGIAAYYITSTILHSLPAFMPNCPLCIHHAESNLPLLLCFLNDVKNGDIDTFATVVRGHNTVNAQIVHPAMVTDADFEAFMRKGIVGLFNAFGKRPLINGRTV